MTSWRIPISYLILTFVGLVFANIFIYRNIFAAPVLTVNVFMVGKGTATFVQTPSARTILIDTGSDASILRALGSALPPWQRSIDAVVLTSASTKVTGGLSAIQGRYHISKIEKSPFGKTLSLDGISIQALSTASPSAYQISYGNTSLTIASGTPPGVYISNGETFAKND